jgi:WD40 repeat protein
MTRPSRWTFLLFFLAMAPVAGISLIWIARVLHTEEPEPIPVEVVGVLSGHRLPILCCAFSPDSATLVTGSAGGEIRVWDTSTFQLKAILVGHSTDVQDVAFAPDGSRLLSASWDCSVRVWDTDRWELITAIDRKPLPAFSVGFSRDGSHFAVAGGTGQGSIQVFESLKCRLLWSGQGTGYRIQRVAYSRDERTVVTADDGGLVTLWDEQTGAIVGDVRVTTAGLFAINQIAFGTDVSEFVVGQPYNISKWNLRTGLLQKEDRPSYGSYTGFAYSGDRKVFARMWISDKDKYGELQLLTGATGSLVASIKCPCSYLACMCLSPDGKRIATGGRWGTNTALIWDVEEIRKSGRDNLRDDQ